MEWGGELGLVSCRVRSSELKTPYEGLPYRRGFHFPSESVQQEPGIPSYAPPRRILRRSARPYG